jgi:hypothetical protein
MDEPDRRQQEEQHLKGEQQPANRKEGATTGRNDITGRSKGPEEEQQH